MSVRVFIFFLIASIFRLEANDDRPQVLIIGDSVYQMIQQGTTSVLKDQVNVVNSGCYNYHTGMALENFDKMLKGKKWDLILFNFGFNDLMHKDPKTKSIRALHRDAGGVKVSSPEVYKKNLQELVGRLKATGSKIIWGATTPIVGDDGILEAGTEIEYNKIAAGVMKKHAVDIVDMHSHGVKAHKSMRHGKTFNYKHSIPLHTPVSKKILTELNLVKKVKGPVKVFLMIGGMNHMGHGMLMGRDGPRKGSKSGSLDDVALNPKTKDKYNYLVNKEGKWAKRDDVWIRYEHGSRSGMHQVRYAGNRLDRIGPEYALGKVLGDHFSEQVLIYKTHTGHVTLGKDLAPPSSGKKGGWYDRLRDQIDKGLKGIGDYFLNYSPDTKYEIVGMMLDIGEKDKDYILVKKNFPLFIKDLRKELKVLDLPVVLLGSGIGGRKETKYPELIKIQQEVAKSKDRVIFTETRDYWPKKEKSPNSNADEWYGNAESFLSIGEAIGNNFLKLLK